MAVIDEGHYPTFAPRGYLQVIFDVDAFNDKILTTAGAGWGILVTNFYQITKNASLVKYMRTVDVRGPYNCVTR